MRRLTRRLTCLGIVTRPRVVTRLHVCDESGQTTAEYALVILGAAAIATLLLVWAKGSGAIGDLFDEVIGKIL